jgi:hypothetical protein
LYRCRASLFGFGAVASEGKGREAFEDELAKARPTNKHLYTYMEGMGHWLNSRFQQAQKQLSQHCSIRNY